MDPNCGVAGLPRQESGLHENGSGVAVADDMIVIRAEARWL
jgi:hypothetical protein